MQGKEATKPEIRRTRPGVGEEGLQVEAASEQGLKYWLGSLEVSTALKKKQGIWPKINLPKLVYLNNPCSGIWIFQIY
jgi:hypothetical protein